MAAYKLVSCEGTVSSSDDAIAELQALRDEMCEWRDNMEEKLSHTEKYQTVSDAADQLENIDDIDVPDAVKELPISYMESRNTRKKRSPSREIRRDNAVACLEAVITAVEEWLEGLPEDDEAKDDVIAFKESVQEAIDYANGAEFPGMF